jgi:hypothetical protein
MKETRPTITLKLKPYLQEFILAGADQAGLITGDQLIGKLIKPFLHVRPSDVNPTFNSGNEFITFQLPLYNDFNLRSNYYISDQNQKLIETILIIHFKDLFYQYMRDKMRYRNQSFIKCIMQFCFDYNFTYDTMNIEMLKKAFYRKRKNDPKYQTLSKKSCHDLSLACPSDVPGVSLIYLPFLKTTE